MKNLFFVTLSLLSFHLQAQLITYGSFVEPSNHNLENATKFEIEATINEYDWQNNNFYENFRFDFNGIFFKGNTGWDVVAFAIQSLIHEFNPGEIGSRFTNPPSITVNNGVGLYLTRLRADLPYESGGIMLLSDPESYPRFSHTFENVDDLGTLAQNVYTRDNIFENYSFPLKVKWTVTRTGFVTNPTGNLSKNDQDEWVPLIGEYAVWNFKIRLNENEFNIADYYILKENGEFLDTFRPVTLGQEHFGRINEPLGNFKTRVNYKYFRISNNIDCSLINDWKIFRKIEWPEGGNIDDRYGWYSNGTELVSSSSHDTDSQVFRDPEAILNILPPMQYLCPQDLSDDDSDGVVNIIDQCPNTSIGQPVDTKGCELFPFNAFKIYTESPACPEVEDGLIELTASSDTQDYSFDITIIGNGLNQTYSEALSFASPMTITDLASGTYSIKISLANGYNMTFEKVVIAVPDDIAAKRERTDKTANLVYYKVSGNDTYTVMVNSKRYRYEVDDRQIQTIAVPLSSEKNIITIEGADCQSTFVDEICLHGVLLYPNPTETGFYLLSDYVGDVWIYDSSGMIVKTIYLNKGGTNFVPTEELSPGVYFVHLLSSEGDIIKMVKK